LLERAECGYNVTKATSSNADINSCCPVGSNPKQQGGKLMLTAIAIAILVGVAASAVTATFLQAKIADLALQMRDLVNQKADEMAKVREILSNTEKELAKTQANESRLLKDWSSWWSEKQELTKALEAAIKVNKKANKTAKKSVKKANKK